MISNKNRVLWALLAGIVRFYIYFVGKTTKWIVLGEDNYWNLKAKKSCLIIATWHNQLLLFPFIYSHKYHLKSLAALISRSRDGEILGYLINKYGYRIVRGSSSKGGASALIELKRILDEGIDVAITPDGPRGPCYKIQQGVIALASLSGCPILPIVHQVSRYKELKSWDRFKFPYPFNKAALIIGEPFWVSDQSTDASYEAYSKDLEEILNNLNKEAAALVQKS